MSTEILLHCRGNIILSVENANIIISHKKESETIPISHIQSVVLKEPGIFTGIGTITIKTAQPSTAGVSVGFGVILAGGSEKTLNFDESELQTALQIQDYITHYSDQISSLNNAQGSMCVPVADEIRSLKGLLDDGILTQEEFDAKKKQLLGI